MRRLIVPMLCLAPLGGCGSEPPEAVIEIRARIIDNGVATPFLSLGRVTSSAVVEVTDARFELAPRPADQAVAFGPGCFALQLGGPADLSRSAEGTLQVAPSRSLYNQSRGLPSDAEVVPLLASAYRFEDLDSPLEGREALGLLGVDLESSLASAFALGSLDDGVVSLDCFVENVPQSPVSIRVQGAGTVRLGTGGDDCSLADERSCHTVLPVGATETTLEARLLEGSVASIADTLLSPCDLVDVGADQSNPRIMGEVLRARIGPGLCIVTFDEAAWTVRVSVSNDDPQDRLRIVPDATTLGIPSTPEQREWNLPAGVVLAAFDVTDSNDESISVDVAGEGCRTSVRDSGFVAERPAASSLVECTLAREDFETSFRLDLGDSEIAVRLEGLTTAGQGPFDCGAEGQPLGPCTDMDGNVVFSSSLATFPPNELVRITALVDEADFAGCGEVASGRAGRFPYVDVLMDRNRSCFVSLPDPNEGTFPVLEFYLPRTVGTIRVTEPNSGYEQMVAGTGRLVRLQQVPFSTLTVELRPAGHPQGAFSVEAGLVPLSDLQTGVIEAESGFTVPGIDLREVPCVLGDRVQGVAGEPGTYLVDVPGLVADQGGVSSATARVTCAALFECSAEASFDPLVSMTVRDQGGAQFAAEFDCSGGSCQILDPDPSSTADGIDGFQLFLPSPVTLDISASADVDGRALNAFVASPVPNGRALEGSPSVQLFGSVMGGIELGVETELPGALTVDVSDTTITGRVRVCRDGNLEDLVLSAVARRLP